MNGIIQHLSQLNVFLDDYKDDKDIPFLLENIKEHAKNIISFVNLSGFSILDDMQLRANYYQITFDLIKILGLIECLKNPQDSEIAKIFDLNLSSIRFNEKLIILISEINQESLKDNILIDKWVMGLETTNEMMIHFKYMVKNLSSYFFLIRSSNYPIKEYIISAIFRVIYFINELILPINFDEGRVYVSPRDYIEIFAKYENNLRELIGLLEIFFQNFNHLAIKPTESNVIELYVAKDCRLCKIFFENKLFEYIQNMSINLDKGLAIYDSTDDINALARRFFYTIKFVPSIRFPSISNNWKWLNIFPFKDEEQDEKLDIAPSEACKTATIEINNYLFGAFSNIIPTLNKSKTQKKGKNKNREKYLVKLNKIMEIFQKDPETPLTIKEITDEIKENYSNTNYFCKKLIKKGILYTEDPKSLRVKAYRLNFDKYNFEVQRS